MKQNIQTARLMLIGFSLSALLSCASPESEIIGTPNEVFDHDTICVDTGW